MDASNGVEGHTEAQLESEALRILKEKVTRFLGAAWIRGPDCPCPDCQEYKRQFVLTLRAARDACISTTRTDAANRVAEVIAMLPAVVAAATLTTTRHPIEYPKPRWWYLPARRKLLHLENRTHHRHLRTQNHFLVHLCSLLEDLDHFRSWATLSGVLPPAGPNA
jgi:hypothetical protein